MNHNIVYLSVKFSADAATFEYDAKGTTGDVCIRQRTVYRVQHP